MVLWIRSQDRQDLIAVSRHLHIQETSVNPHSHKWGILLDGGRYIGEYNSEERAIEVLDEIQNIIKPNLIINCNQRFEYGTDGMPYSIKTIGTNGDNIQELSTYVYDMPQE